MTVYINTKTIKYSDVVVTFVNIKKIIANTCLLYKLLEIMNALLISDTVHSAQFEV